MKYLPQSIHDENAEDDNFGHGDHVLNASGQRSSAHVDENKAYADQHGHEQGRRLMAGDCKYKT